LPKTANNELVIYVKAGDVKKINRTESSKKCRVRIRKEKTVVFNNHAYQISAAKMLLLQKNFIIEFIFIKLLLLSILLLLCFDFTTFKP
jgi:hypothetical protein